MKLFVFGSPGDIGGACTELWHTLKLWRQFDVEVHLIPSWYCEPKWERLATDLGCIIHSTSSTTLAKVPGLSGSTVVSFCNGEFLSSAAELKSLNCKLVWVNCMTWLFEDEKKFYEQHGPFDAFVFQSDFQQSELEPQLKAFGYRSELGFKINGAFDLEEWPFNPLPHLKNETFYVGRAARPDADKWSSHTFPIYERIQYPNKRALLMGVDANTGQKLGQCPDWIDCLKPRALSARQFFGSLHCTLPVNGGARENWPRVGLEAMAMGVPIVTQNLWGWQEMIQHGVTGFLGDSDQEMAHWAATLAFDEDLRLKIAHNAREYLTGHLAEPNRLWRIWKQLFTKLQGSNVPELAELDSQDSAPHPEHDNQGFEFQPQQNLSSGFEFSANQLATRD